METSSESIQRRNKEPARRGVIDKYTVGDKAGVPLYVEDTRIFRGLVSPVVREGIKSDEISNDRYIVDMSFMEYLVVEIKRSYARGECCVVEDLIRLTNRRPTSVQTRLRQLEERNLVKGIKVGRRIRGAFWKRSRLKVYVPIEESAQYENADEDTPPMSTLRDCVERRFGTGAVEGELIPSAKELGNRTQSPGYRIKRSYAPGADGSPESVHEIQATSQLGE